LQFNQAFQTLASKWKGCDNLSPIDQAQLNPDGRGWQLDEAPLVRLEAVEQTDRMRSKSLLQHLGQATLPSAVEVRTSVSNSFSQHLHLYS
jgi:hypothetical protein